MRPYLLRVLGWLADLFRLAWGLFFWNTRKAWFQRSRGRAKCPCQNPSDSGRAFETGCEACVNWDKPQRFRHVCPLLVETKDGLRCAANTAEVRPFWGRMFRYYGGTLLAIYLGGAVTVFAVLRTIGYPINVGHVVWPGLWYRVPQARGWFFAQKSQKAFAAGRTAEGLLYLSNAYQFDPGSYQITLALAKSLQVGRPRESDLLFERVLHEHPAQRDATAAEWFRALLARGDFRKIATLAHTETLADTAHAHVWVRALLFATRQFGDDTQLRQLLADRSSAAAPWRQLLDIELLLRGGGTREARAALDRPWPADASPFTVYYRVSTLTALGDTYAALDTLEANRARLGSGDSTLLRLDALAAGGAKRPLAERIDELLAQKLTLANIMVLCTHLVRHPAPAVFARLVDKAQQENLPLDSSTAGAWFTLLCTAGAVGDLPRLHALVITLKLNANSPFIALNAVESFFRGESGAEKITTYLPLIPLPLEMNYALLERFLPPPAVVTAPVLKP